MPELQSDQQALKVMRTHLQSGIVRFRTGFVHPVKGYHGMHKHETMEIVYHPRGSGQTSIENVGTVSYQQGSGIIYAPGEMHDQDCDVAGEDACIHIDLGPSPPPALFQFRHFLTSDDPFLVNELHLLARAHLELDFFGQLSLDLRSRALLAYLLHVRTAVVATAERAPDRLADKAKRYIREHCDQILNIEEIAQALHIGEDYLRHSFTARHGMTPVRWLALSRIEKAKDLLTHTGLPLKQVARGCGFESEQYFCAVFRKFCGMTPSVFRSRR